MHLPGRLAEELLERHLLAALEDVDASLVVEEYGMVATDEKYKVWF